MLKKIISNKIGIITGFSIAFLYVIYLIIILKKIAPSLDVFLGLGIVIGGMSSGFVVEHYIIRKATNLGPIWGGITGSILITPLSLYYGIIPAMFGAMWANVFLTKLGLGGFPGISIALAIVYALWIIIIEYIGAIIGFALGFLVQKLVQRVS